MSTPQLDPQVGFRFAQARRLLGVALGRDLSQAAAAELAGVSSNAWNEWERGLSYPQGRNMEKFLALFVANGMSYITQQWIDYGTEAPDFPRVITVAFEAGPRFPEVPTMPAASSRTTAKSARSRPKKSGDQGR